MRLTAVHARESSASSTLCWLLAWLAHATGPHPSRMLAMPVLLDSEANERQTLHRLTQVLSGNDWN
jgi:hypothetical protein